MRKHYVSFIFLFMLFIPHAPIAWSCEPRPDYWFAERYEFGPVDLPESVNMVQSPQDVAIGYFQIRNHSDLPLYVLPMDARSFLVTTVKPSTTSDGLSEEQTHEEIFLLDQVPELAAFVIEAGESLQLDIENFPALVAYIEDRNILDYSRPAFFYLPISQRGEFHLVHDEQLISVSFSISYAVNENFNPDVCGGEIEPVVQQTLLVADKDASVLISTITFIVICVIALGAVVLLQKRVE